MPLSHRSSGDLGRKEKQSGRFTSHHLPSYYVRGADQDYVARDMEESLRDQLKCANTELNKVLSERDRFETSCKQLKKTVTETAGTVADLKKELAAVKKERDDHSDELEQAKADYDALLKKHKAYQKSFDDLQADYDSLLSRYNTAKGSSSTSSPHSSPIPDRAKEARPSKKEYKEYRDDRYREDRDRDNGRDRGRGRDKDKEKREQEEEKKRLSKRFEGRPPVTKRRDSCSQGQWSSGGRSSSQNPSSRYPNGRPQAPQLVQGHPPYGSSVPRTPNPLSPTASYSNSGSSGFNDDSSYEDGNYHAYPIQR